MDALAAHPGVSARIRDCYQVFEQYETQARDGQVIVTHEIGEPHLPPVVLVSPIGVPLIVVSRLAQRLAGEYRVICWEQRGFGATSKEFFATPHDYPVYVADLVDVMASRAGLTAAVIGICSGASLVIKAVACGVIRPAAVALVSPAVFFGPGFVPSAFDTSVVPFMRLIDGKNRQLAEDLFELRLSAARRTALEEVDDALIVEAADTMSGSSIDGLLVYSRIVKTFTDQKLDAEIAAVTQSVHVFAAADDTTVSIRSSRRLKELLPSAVLHEYPGGGHFCVFTRPDLQGDVLAAMRLELRPVPAGVTGDEQSLGR